MALAGLEGRLLGRNWRQPRSRDNLLGGAGQGIFNGNDHGNRHKLGNMIYNLYKCGYIAKYTQSILDRHFILVGSSYVDTYMYYI